MGKAPKLLNILCTERALFETPEVQKLISQGHSIQLVESGADGLIGGKCWRMNAAMAKYLPLAIRAMREEKYKK